MSLPLRVDVDMTLADVGADIGGQLHGKGSVKIGGVALDTRALKKGDLFFALKAVRDGHEFIGEAIAKGAAAAILEDGSPETLPFIRVKDVYQALGALARQVRIRWGKEVVALSGSNGKTTTKEMVAALLSSSRKVLKAPGTWNNHLGVPLSLLMLRPEHEVCVLELGISAPGEMKGLTDIAKPSIAVLTNIGPSHLEKLQSVEGVAKAKGELFSSLGSGDVVIVNCDDPRIVSLARGLKAKQITVARSEAADVQGESKEDLGLEGMLVEVKYGKTTLTLKVPFLGKHNVSNLLCALGVCLALDVPVDRLQLGLDAVAKPAMRFEIVESGENIRLINDCYNANPESMLAALEVCKSLPATRRIAILGDMMELGELSARAHRDAGIHVAQQGFDLLYSVGRYAGDYAQGAIQGGMTDRQVRVMAKKDEVIDVVANKFKPGDLVLVKASRAMKLEEVSKAILEEIEKGRNG